MLLGDTMTVHAPCSFVRSLEDAHLKTHPDRLLLIATSGGLNQQRTGVIPFLISFSHCFPVVRTPALILSPIVMAADN